MPPKNPVWKRRVPIAFSADNSGSRRPHSLRLFLEAASVLALFMAAVQIVPAQGTASVGFQSVVPLISSPYGATAPFGLVKDKSGDLFISDFSNDRVVEIPAGCTDTGCETTVPTVGLNEPTGIAVDASGDLFIADYNNNRVVEVPWTSGGYGTQITLPSTGQNHPSGVAVDGAGDLFIANDDYQGMTTNRVVELPWTGSGYGAPVTVINWLNGPFGLAFDTSGDLFIADFGGYQVVELPKGCSSSTCQKIIAGGLSSGPVAVLVDRDRNVFIALFDGNQVFEVPAGCSSSACQIQLGNGLKEPTGLVIDGAGNIYIADYGNSRLLDINQDSFNFGTVSLGASGRIIAYFDFNSVVALNSSSPYSVMTQGISGLDFIDNGGGTCAGTSYTSGQSCTVQIGFKPHFAGLVTGAIELVDSNGNNVATGYLGGIGSGPQLTFSPGTRSSVGVNLASSSGVAVDRNGNIFVADTVNRAVEEILAPAYTTTRSLGGSFSFNKPMGVAVDGAGNVFVADASYPGIEEINAPAYTTVTTLGSGFSNPSGVAVDHRGNLYVADTGHNSIAEVLEANGYTQIETLASTFNAPAGVTVDSAGNVFVADTGNNALKEILATNGSIPSTPTINILGSGFSAPTGVSVDGMGNVYVADTGNDAVDELTATGGFTQINHVGSGFGGPSGVAVDSGGNVYIGSPAGTQVVKLDYADPPTLNFEASVGTASSSQAVTVTNYGNAQLAFASPSSGYNPNVSADFSLATSTTTGSPCPMLAANSGTATLAAGASCVDQLTFSPSTAGSVNGSIIITDNDLNVTGSTQSVALIGKGVVISFAPTSLASAQVGTAYSQTIAASGGTAPYSYRVTAGAVPAGITVLNSGTISGTPSAAGSFSFTVTATDADGLNANQAYSLSVSAPTLKLMPSSLAGAQVNVAYSATLTASGGTAPYSYNVTSGSLPAGLSLSSSGVLSGTPTASGSFTFTVTASDSSTGTGAPFSVADSYALAVSLPVSASDFSFTATGSTSATISPGGAATFNFALAPTNSSYPGTVTFSVAGLPAGATGTLSATSVSSNAGPQTITLSVKASSSNSAFVRRKPFYRRFSPLVLAFLLPLLGLRTIRLGRRKLLSVVGLMILLVAGTLAILPLSGCGAASGVLGRSYSVSVMASSGTVQHTAFVNVTVN